MSVIPLILASTSSYKRQQLEILKVPFSCEDPEIDEVHDENMCPQELAQDLAYQKALALSSSHPNTCIIGSDQTAISESNQLLTKPGTTEKGIQQLLKCQNTTVHFHSAICLLFNELKIEWTIQTDVIFRKLTLNEIKRYIEADNPLNCAGSFKIESLGISLFEKIHSDDPSALIGLPLISLSRELRQLGYQIP